MVNFGRVAGEPELLLLVLVLLLEEVELWDCRCRVVVTSTLARAGDVAGEIALGLTAEHGGAIHSHLSLR